MKSEAPVRFSRKRVTAPQRRPRRSLCALGGEFSGSDFLLLLTLASVATFSGLCRLTCFPLSCLVLIFLFPPASYLLLCAFLLSVLSLSFLSVKDCVCSASLYVVQGDTHTHTPLHYIENTNF